MVATLHREAKHEVTELAKHDLEELNNIMALKKIKYIKVLQEQVNFEMIALADNLSNPVSLVIVF